MHESYEGEGRNAFPFVMSDAGCLWGLRTVTSAEEVCDAHRDRVARAMTDHPSVGGGLGHRGNLEHRGNASGPDRLAVGPCDGQSGQMEYSPEKDSKTHRTRATIPKKAPMMNSHQPMARPANMTAPARASHSGVHELATK